MSQQFTREHLRNGLHLRVDTPAHLQTTSGVARVFWEIGSRQAPLVDEDGMGGFDFREQLAVLDQDDPLERAIWAVAMIFGGTFPLIHHFGPDSCLHHSRWPGYPEGWQALWYGRLWHLRLPDETKRVRSRRLMRAGVVELANLCNAEGDGYLTAEQAAVECRWIREFGAVQDFADLGDFMKAAGIAPVRGRSPWAAADAKRGRVAPGNPVHTEIVNADPEYGRERFLWRRRREERKASGDGGRQLAGRGEGGANEETAA